MASKLYFDPPLWLQRQEWVLTKLRQERVDSVVDVGCANGTLLSALMQPAFQSDRFPVERYPLLSKGQRQDDEAEGLLPSRHWTHASADINLRRIAGLDIDPEAVRSARSALSLHGQAIAETRPRWRSLDVKLFEGPLEVENKALESYDAFVATEVIEHLDEPSLEQFGPSILGKYRPRLLLITTPNYCFNEHFGGNLSTRPGFPDPSGRTDRVFRHDDHKFEWTPEEFGRWCQALAEDYGYEVAVDGLGQGIYRKQAGQSTGADRSRRPRTGDNGDERLRYASQTALFRRHSASPRSDHQEEDAVAQRAGAYFGVNATLHEADAAMPSVSATPNKHYAQGGRADDYGDGDDDDDDDERSRRARSRRPENLPFLSSPATTSTLVPPVPLGATVARVPSPGTPFLPDFSISATRSHRLLWNQTYPCWQPGPRAGVAAEPPSAPIAKVSRPAQGLPDDPTATATTLALAPDVIRGGAVEKQRQLFIAAQWSEYDEGGAKLSASNPVWEAKAKLLDVWYDDDVRGSCAGRMATLLDALQLVGPDGTNPTTVGTASERALNGSEAGTSTTTAQAKRQEIVVGTNGRDWELRVIVEGRQDPSTLTGTGMVAAAAATGADDAALTDSDLWLVYCHRETVKEWHASIQEAKRWIPQSYARRGRASGSAAARAPSTGSWD